LRIRRCLGGHPRTAASAGPMRPRECSISTRATGVLPTACRRARSPAPRVDCRSLTPTRCEARIWTMLRSRKGQACRCRSILRTRRPGIGTSATASIAAASTRL
jgi:hypothetical protein